MTWLVWRQHRFEVLGMLIGAALIAATLVYGADLAVRTRAELGVDTCQPLPNTNSNCVTLAVQAGERLQPFRWLIIVLFFLPALVGSFVGGPLFARELERGTHRLVWTQGITRLRWAGVKLGGVLLFAALAGAIVALAGGSAFAISGSRTDAYMNFALEGPAFVSYVIFAISVAAFAGTLSRRILGGMLAGLLVFAVINLGVQFILRPNYEPPVVVITSSDTAAMEFQTPEGAWVIGSDHVDAAGHVVAPARVRALMDEYRPRAGWRAFGGDLLSYLAENDVYQRIRYQPADRYWRFQWTEALLFMTLSAAMRAATLQLLHRRDA
jgi:hypothetical protein